MSKHKPATPLPFRVAGANFASLIGKDATVGSTCTFEDAHYIAHAANAYPRLVALAKLVPGMDGDISTRALAKRLLRELGEAE